ncbi:hypothetical protein PsorP6_009102 [Peronosclerospora sorghi]|uniref:Uncharacterized protein n=1 Tax=Peronosclerospora sorghi TaxID=230839 RepID=A0ACC0W1R7_9STRA|nr:hypothetical protein PsorP6_009102 [Peronosclerospora sorghi]
MKRWRAGTSDRPIGDVGMDALGPSACAFTVASFLTVAYECCPKGPAMFDPLIEACPPSLEKEFESLMAVTKFCRWTFSLLEHSEDAKVILETAKCCCPIHTDTKREARKFTTQLDRCLLS